jgi:hypothetical protein
VKIYAFELKRVIETMLKVIYLIESINKNTLFYRVFLSPFAFVYRALRFFLYPGWMR